MTDKDKEKAKAYIGKISEKYLFSNAELECAKQGYIEELKEENKELKKQIEKMKCCQICKYLTSYGSCAFSNLKETRKWKDFSIGTRRTHRCKNWECTEINEL